MTVTSHAVLLYTSLSVYLISYNLITCQFVHNLSKAGLVFVILGIWLMISDPYAIKTNAEEPSILGSVIAFLGAGAGATTVKINTFIPKDVHPFTRLLGIFSFSFLTYSIVVPFFLGFDVYYSFQPKIGLFWWLFDLEMFLFLFFVVWLFCGIIGNSGLYASYHYFPIEIISGVMLMEPVFAQIAGILLKQDNVPGIITLIGGLTITTAFLMIGYGEKLKDKRNLEIKQKQSDDNENEMSVL